MEHETQIMEHDLILSKLNPFSYYTLYVPSVAFFGSFDKAIWMRYHKDSDKLVILDRCSPVVNTFLCYLRAYSKRIFVL